MASWAFASGAGQIASGHHVDDPIYREASTAIGESNLYHRKHWEWVFIYATMQRVGVLAPGHTAIGFGVGTEPLVPAFAAAGMSVLATDQPHEQAGAWADTGQHSTSVDHLQRPTICDPEVLRSSVSFRSVDMTNLPGDLGRHDVVWSSCCFEHLGTPDAGIDFVRTSMWNVAPGGVAVHTTEFDLTRRKPLLESGSVDAGDYVCFYRRQELRRLVNELRRDGFEVEMDWRVSRRHPMERKIDRPPYTHDPHLRIAVADRVITSVGLVVRVPR